MKLLLRMKPLLRIVLFTVLFTGVAAAQVTSEPVVPPIAAAPVVAAQERHSYRFQVLGGYVNSEIKNPLEIIQNARTLSIDAKVNVIDKGGWTFGPAFNYQRAYDVEVVPESFIYPDGIYRDVDTYFGGVELAKKAGPVRIGGGVFLGARRDFLTMEYGRVRKYRGFVEIASGHFVVRPFFAETEVTGSIFANRINKYGVAGGIGF